MASSLLSRALRGTLATGLVLAGIVLVPSPVLADPLPPSDATEAQQQLAELGHEAEVVTEQLHDAQITLDTRLAEEQAAQAQLATAEQAVAAAEAEAEQFRGTVDQLTLASYQGARLNRLSALMTSTSPQELLDQMSGLELLASDTGAQLDVYSAASAAAESARADATAATTAAQQARDEAATVQADLVATQADLETRTAAVQAQYETLSAPEQASYAGEATPVGYAVPAAGSGSGQGYAALQAALTKIGSPYVWGAAGPDSFDCSGLTSWAFKQAGVTIPRSSGAQAAGGTPVSRDQLQPGDLVFFYSPVSHVGIYAGDGNVVHASTYGQPVKVAPMGQMPFTSASRY